MTVGRGSLVACLATLVLALAACGGSGEESGLSVPAPDGPSTRTSREPLRIDAPVRPEAPAIEGETLDGKQVSLADLRGRPVFVKVFAGY